MFKAVAERNGQSAQDAQEEREGIIDGIQSAKEECWAHHGDYDRMDRDVAHGMALLREHDRKHR
jgi:hypothetical protein